MTRRVTGFAVALMLLAGTSHAGGTPENALLVIDPLSPDSLHVGNYYWHARGFAPNSILYLDPDATNYPTWVQTVQPGFLGELTQRAIRPHTQFVIVTPGNNFFVNAPGLLSDMCTGQSLLNVGTLHHRPELCRGPHGHSCIHGDQPVLRHDDCWAVL
ncbi:MAG: hypothetical protein KF705_01505 [Phycisphaeraceae bacterium]|nr:hypothetical protein [Phycisphaeraceae bacterium]